MVPAAPLPRDRTAQQQDDVAQALLAAIVNSCQDAIIGKTLDGVITSWNSGAEQIYGYTALEMIGQPIARLIPPDRGDELVRILDRIRQGERVEPFETQRVCKDGRRIHVWLTVSPVKELDGTIVGASAIARDITERKWTEALLASEREVLELVARGTPLGAVLDTLTRTIEAQAGEGLLASILLLDEDGVHLRHGAAPSLPTVYNRAIDGLAIGPCAGSCGTAAFRREPVVVGDIATDPLWAEFRGLALPHGLRACWSTPLTGSDGRVLGTFALYYREPRRPSPQHLRLAALVSRTAAVVVERKRAEEERERLFAAERAARAEAEAAMAARDAITATVTHDLKNPLTGISGWAQLLRRRASRGAALDNDELLQALGTIESTAKRMTNLLDDLLDVARLQAGRPLELRRRPTDLVALARQAIEVQQQSTDRHVIELVAAVPSLVGRWDGHRLERVLANLLSNAIKYSPKGGTITVEIEAQEEEAVLVVRDQGLGIPAADLPHIFDRFHRASNVAGRIAGTGLGLAGAREIVAQHGGEVSVDSREGAGTMVTVRLPLRDQVQG